MNKRLSLSNDFSLFTRKYFFAPFFLIIASYFFCEPLGFKTFLAIILLVIGLFYFALKIVEFDDEFVYIGRKKYSFKEITKLSSLEVNMFVFPYIEINDKGRKRRIVTDSGQAGILHILLGLVFPRLDPLKNVKRFKELFDASR